MPDSPIVRFYDGQGTDSRGRTLAEIQAFDHARMEYIHDYIQWMFPLRQASAFNPGSPLLTDEDVRAFHERPALRAALRRSFEQYLNFLGLALDPRNAAVRELDGLGTRRKVFDVPNHNWLRITRVLLCLKTLGLDAECRAFFAYLETVFRDNPGVTRETFAYWSDAARGVARGDGAGEDGSDSPR